VNPASNIAALLVLIASGARAYTIETNFTARCHEKLTAEALRNARLQLELPASPAATSDERALIDDLQFAPGADMSDLAGATLLAAVRDNDLKGNSQDDLSVLSAIHGNPDNQMEHCLRGPDEKEPDGSAQAVAACRAFIRGRVLQALDGLGADGLPDFANRTPLPLYLSFRGHVDAPLPTYYVRIGQAMHAVQDSFTHTYRTPDSLQITVVLNWLGEVGGTLLESRDGPAHASKLDACDDPDELRKTRRVLATAASTALLIETLRPGATRDQRMAAVETILDTYLAYSPGCTFDNGWCHAPEAQYKDAKGLLGCSSGGASWAALAIVAVMFRKRRRAAALVVAFALAAGTARADEPDTHAPPAPTLVIVEEPGPRDPSQTAWGAYLGASGSVDKSAVAAQLGVRLKVSTHWTLGLDAEWNPWITLENAHVGSGVFNLYGGAILRFPLAYENFNLRATVNLGGSLLLMSLYGAPAGSLGLYAGISPAGLEWKLSRRFILVVNPLNIALPVPQLSGVPLTYPQYRFSIGFEIQQG
jgi:hypothetical protein